MPRRIEIELTSAQPDGNWTWRAAGARQPKGVVSSDLLYDGAKPGDVVRAEADFELDGISILSVTAPKEKKRAEPERIEVLGPSGPEVPGVTTQLFGRSERRPGERRGGRDEVRGGGDRGPRDGAERGPRPERRGPRPDTDGRRPRRDAADRPDGPHSAPDAARAREHPDRPDGTRPAGDPSRRRERPRTGAPTGSRPAGPRPDGSAGPDRDLADRSAGGEAGRGARPDPARGRRLNAASVHRQAVLDTLAAEERPIAEQVLRGGIPAVRTALHLERERAAAEGRPAPNSDALLAIAEQLLPRLKTAEWRDRAEAAVKVADDISLRDLRAVVTGADLARDEETRALATALRESLERRLEKLQADWVGEIVHHLDERRVVRALRLASRPPEPSARLDAELTTRLADAASEAMAPDTPPERWAALLDAVAASPVRRTVKPVGLPAEPGPELRRSAHQQSGRIPALAVMLGVAIPPPPGPIRAPGEATADPGRRPPPPPRRRPPRPGAPPTAGPVGAKGATPAGASASAPVPEPAPADHAAPAPEPATDQPAPAPVAAPPTEAAVIEPAAAAETQPQPSIEIEPRPEVEAEGAANGGTEEHAAAVAESSGGADAPSSG